MLEGSLCRFGLNQKEASIYLALLELGPSLVSSIARKARVNRTTCYTVLDDMMERGLVSRVERRGTQYYSATAPQIFVNELQQRAKMAQALLPQLAAIANLYENKPIIHYYEGETGVKNIYEDTLQDGKEILAFISPHAASRSLLEYLSKDYVGRRIAKGIKAKAIVPDTPFNRKKYQQLDKQELRESRMLPRQDFPLETEIMTYGDKVALISFQAKEMVGVLIESQAIAKSMRAIFSIVWKCSLLYNK